MKARSSHRRQNRKGARGPLRFVDAALGIEGVTERRAVLSSPQHRRPITIERTSKQYKFGMLVGRFFLYVGLGMLGYSFYLFHLNFGRHPATFGEFLADQRSAYVSIAGIIGGYLLYRWEVFLAWWNNG